MICKKHIYTPDNETNWKAAATYYNANTRQAELAPTPKLPNIWNSFLCLKYYDRIGVLGKKVAITNKSPQMINVRKEWWAKVLWILLVAVIVSRDCTDHQLEEKRENWAVVVIVEFQRDF